MGDLRLWVISLTKLKIDVLSGRIMCGKHTKRWQQRNQLFGHIASFWFFSADDLPKDNIP